MQAYVVMIPSGEKFAVERAGDKITGCTGPLHYSDVKPENLGNYDCADQFARLGMDGDAEPYEEGTDYQFI